jgi:hypothetical protein
VAFAITAMQRRPPQPTAHRLPLQSRSKLCREWPPEKSGKSKVLPKQRKLMRLPSKTGQTLLLATRTQLRLPEAPPSRNKRASKALGLLPPACSGSEAKREIIEHPNARCESSRRAFVLILRKKTAWPIAKHTAGAFAIRA